MKEEMDMQLHGYWQDLSLIHIWETGEPIMLKKLVSCVSALLIGASCAAMTAGAAAKTVFSDDFSSGKFDKWTNPAIDNDPDRKDTECEGVAQIKGCLLYTSKPLRRRIRRSIPMSPLIWKATRT